MVDNRVTYRRRHSYNTRSNRVKIVKTPGSRLLVQYRTKKATGPRCGDCGKSVHGIPALRPFEYSQLQKCQRTVSRAYGGSRCGGCVRNRILRAFLIEEQKIVREVMKQRAAEEKAASKKK